jgi:hypothetical protein
LPNPPWDLLNRRRMSTTEPFRSQLMLSERSQNQRPGRRQSSHPRRAPCLGAVSTFAIQADGTCRGRLPAFGDLPVMLSTKSLTDSTGVPCDGRRPPRRDRGERNRTSHSCLSDARAALGLGDRVLHCWGSIPWEEDTPQFGLSEAIGPPTRSPCDCRSGELRRLNAIKLRLGLI